MRRIKSALLLSAMAATVVLSIGQPLQAQAEQMSDVGTTVTGVAVPSAEGETDTEEGTADTLEAADVEAVSTAVPTPSQVYQTMIAMKASYLGRIMISMHGRAVDNIMADMDVLRLRSY